MCKTATHFVFIEKRGGKQHCYGVSGFCQVHAISFGLQLACKDIRIRSTHINCQAHEGKTGQHEVLF